MPRKPEELHDIWLVKAGKNKDITGETRNRIILAGNFLTYIAHLNFDRVNEALKGFDFSKKLTQINGLPDRVYVQYTQKYTGHWFTNTGLTTDAVGLTTGCRKRRLFKPHGTVCALKGIAAGIKDTWTMPEVIDLGQLSEQWEALKARALKSNIKFQDSTFEKWKSRVGSMANGGGVQYFVAEPSKMDLLK